MEQQGVVITGASTGIGADCALTLERLGYRVFAGVRRPSDGNALKALAGPRLTPLLLDVTDAASIAAASDSVKAAMGDTGLAGLVNNAGIGVGGPLEVVPLADLRRQFEVNVFGLVAVTQAFLPLLRQGRGRVINMGSIAGRAAMPFMGPYSASKFAVEALTDALRLELQAFGIHVSVIEPGAIATPIWGKSEQAVNAWGHTWSPEAKALYEQAVASVREAVAKVEARAQPPSLVTKAVVHALCSSCPKTRYLVGADARLRAVMVSWLPDRLQDKILSWVLKLPPRP